MLEHGQMHLKILGNVKEGLLHNVSYSQRRTIVLLIAPVLVTDEQKRVCKQTGLTTLRSQRNGRRVECRVEEE